MKPQFALLLTKGGQPSAAVEDGARIGLLEADALGLYAGGPARTDLIIVVALYDSPAELRAEGFEVPDDVEGPGAVTRLVACSETTSYLRSAGEIENADLIDRLAVNPDLQGPVIGVHHVSTGDFFATRIRAVLPLSKGGDA